NSGSNKKRASRRLGSSFQNAQPTSAKFFRRRISAACARVGALESGFTVDPCATMRSAELELLVTIQRSTSNAQRSTSNLIESWALSVERWAFNLKRCGFALTKTPI